MKAKLLLVGAFLSALTGCCGVSQYYFSNPGLSGYSPSSTCTTCACADPACRNGFGNPCLDRATCCDVFGNIGAYNPTQYK